MRILHYNGVKAEAARYLTRTPTNAFPRERSRILITNGGWRNFLDMTQPEVKVAKMSSSDCSWERKESEGERVDAFMSNGWKAGSLSWKGFIIALLAGTWMISATEVGLRAKKPPEIIGWAYVKTPGVQLRRKHKESARPLLKLRRGAVLPVFRIHAKKGPRWFAAVGVNLGDATPLRGWISEDQVELLGRDAAPGDRAVLAQMGRPFSEDRISASAQVARLFWQSGGSRKDLVVTVASLWLPAPVSRVFEQVEGEYVPAPEARQFSPPDFSAEGGTGIESMEVLDLIGDGRECLITVEGFQQGPKIEGRRLVIRRLSGGKVEKIWDAPTMVSNLGSYPGKLKILRPPELNIGQPATVTHGKVEFISRPQGGFLFRWEGEIEFYLLGRDAPVEIISLKKTFRWNGREFSAVPEQQTSD